LFRRHALEFSRQDAGFQPLLKTIARNYRFSYLGMDTLEQSVPWPIAQCPAVSCSYGIGTATRQTQPVYTR
ncbi:MAG: hypothetical protein AAFQ57_02290, partial [Cyanobacteria bacterium J06626_14]